MLCRALASTCQVTTSGRTGAAREIKECCTCTARQANFARPSLHIPYDVASNRYSLVRSVPKTPMSSVLMLKGYLHDRTVVGILNTRFFRYCRSTRESISGDDASSYSSLQLSAPPNPRAQLGQVPDDASHQYHSQRQEPTSCTLTFACISTQVARELCLPTLTPFFQIFAYPASSHLDTVGCCP